MFLVRNSGLEVRKIPMVKKKKKKKKLVVHLKA